MALLSSKLLKYVGAESLGNPASGRCINARDIILALVPDCLRYPVRKPIFRSGMAGDASCTTDVNHLLIFHRNRSHVRPSLVLTMTLSDPRRPRRGTVSLCLECEWSQSGQALTNQDQSKIGRAI
jgi:hypothetical protein